MEDLSNVEAVQIGRFKGVAIVEDIEPELFSSFMMARFPGETDVLYIKEWAERFKSGNPIAHMDSKSKKAYLECLKAY